MIAIALKLDVTHRKTKPIANTAIDALRLHST